jgi:hypothetical protein
VLLSGLWEGHVIQTLTTQLCIFSVLYFWYFLYQTYGFSAECFAGWLAGFLGVQYKRLIEVILKFKRIPVWMTQAGEEKSMISTLE